MGKVAKVDPGAFETIRGPKPETTNRRRQAVVEYMEKYPPP